MAEFSEEELRDNLAVWKTEADISEAARARERKNSLVNQANEMATFSSVADSLVRAEAIITVSTSSGNVYRGTLASYAPPFLAIVTEHADVWIRESSISQLAAQELTLNPDYEPSTPAPNLLSIMFSDWAESRDRVQLVFEGATSSLSGEVLTAGLDIATIRTDLPHQRQHVVRLDAVTEIVRRRN